MTSYGRKVKINVTETSLGMKAELPLMELKGRKTRVGYQMVNWMISRGWLRYADLLHIILFKDLNEFVRADGDKEIQIKMVESLGGENNGE